VLSILTAIASSVIGLLLPNMFGDLVDKAKEGAVVSLLKIPALKAIGMIAHSINLVLNVGTGVLLLR
jgi:hypothetical protein